MRRNYDQCVHDEEVILEIVSAIRKKMPRIGCRKLHKMLNNNFAPELRVGRDVLFGILRVNGLLIRRKP
jgi:hypothetical protein